MVRANLSNKDGERRCIWESMEMLGSTGLDCSVCGEVGSKEVKKMSFLVGITRWIVVPLIKLGSSGGRAG